MKRVYPERSRRAFTLIELLTVMAIISILAAVVVVSVAPARERARDTKRKADLRTVQNALEQYYYKNQSYPIGPPSGMYYSVWDEIQDDSKKDWEQDQGQTLVFYNALVGGGFLTQLPDDPLKDTEDDGGYLNDGDQSYGYVYCSKDDQGYVLGTNLESINRAYKSQFNQNTGSPSLGEYQIKVGASQPNCPTPTDCGNKNCVTGLPVYQ